MPIAKTMYTCSISGKLFETEEQAKRSEELSPKVKVWSDSVKERINTVVQKNVDELTVFFEEINKQNGSPFIPFTAVVDRSAIRISVRSYASTVGMPAAQGVMWESLHDLLLKLADSGTTEQFVISNISVICIIIEMSEYFGGVGKYAITQPDTEKQNDTVLEDTPLKE